MTLRFYQQFNQSRPFSREKQENKRCFATLQHEMKSAGNVLDLSALVFDLDKAGLQKKTPAWKGKLSD